MLTTNKSGDATNPFWSVFLSLYLFLLSLSLSLCLTLCLSLSVSLCLSPSLWPIHPACSSFEDLEHAVLDGEASLPVQGIGLPGVLDGSGSSDVFWCVGDVGVPVLHNMTSYLG